MKKQVILDEIEILEMDLKDLQDRYEQAELEADLFMINETSNQINVVYAQIDVLNTVLDRL